MPDAKPDVYLEPAGPVQIEEKIQRSVFIARLEPCHDESSARDFLNRVRTEHRDATHNCWAYLLNADAVSGRPETANSSDDGEPSGTAGRPILGALRRSGLVNAMVIVTRYFGGVKLGVRGLIDAYGGARQRHSRRQRPWSACPPVRSQRGWAGGRWGT